jgi:glutathione S-transferase
VVAARRTAHRMLRVLDDHLWFGEQEARAWLCPGAHPTVADVALEGRLPERPALDRPVKRVDRFVSMSGVFPTGPGLPDAAAAGGG